MTLQRRFAPTGGRFEPESVAGFAGIYIPLAAALWAVVAAVALANRGQLSRRPCPINPSCRMFLKQFREDVMPPAVRDGKYRGAVLGELFGPGRLPARPV